MKPLNAPTIWIEGFDICVELPSPDGKIAHTIKYRDEPAGYRQLMHMLRHRQGETKLCEPGDPTQHNVDKLVAQFKKKSGKPSKKVPTKEEREAAKSFLSRLGITA